MPQHPGLNGSITGTSTNETCPVALLLIDVINDFDCPEGEPIGRFIPHMAERIAGLKKRAKAAKVPCVYVNDNFGRWRSDVHQLVEYCRHEKARCREVMELLAPEPDDYFVLKPMLSGFYATVLDPLLHQLEVKTVILAGVCANVCVFFTAADAYMRGYKLWVPSDCVAAATGTECGHALDQMRRTFKAEVHPSSEIDVEALARRSPDRVAVDAAAVLAKS
jgi:nicotinamidase-related amidase